MTYLPRSAAQEAAFIQTVVGDSGSGGTKGAVPAPSAGDAASGKFLKADGSWAVPAGLPSISDGQLLANISGSSHTPDGQTISDLFDYVMGSTQGKMFQRDDSHWKGWGSFSYSPHVYFGSGHIGQTASSTVGEWFFLGNLLVASFAITLTAKGSSTGIAGIELPVSLSAGNLIGGGMITNYSNLDAGVTSLPFLRIHSSVDASVARIRKAGAGTITTLTNSDFTDTSVVEGYLVHAAL